MHSKNKLAIFCLAACIALVQQTSVAQTSIEYTPGTFSMGFSPINPGQYPPAYYKVFLETGNGRYIKAGPVYDAPGIAPLTISYPYRININATAVATVSSYYDTTPRPPRQHAIAASNTRAPLPPQQFSLDALTGKAQTRIGIDACAETIVPGDTMAFALIYKPFSAAGTNTIVAFFYNKTLEGGNIFSPVNQSTTYYFNNNQPTNAIRPHNSETISSALPAGLPPDVSTKLAAAGSGFAQALYMLIPAGLDESEKNIFLSLAPYKNILSYNGNTATKVAATIIQYNSLGAIPGSQQNYIRTLGINLIARDPNGITTTPHCFAGSEGIVDPHNTPIKTEIKFENDGPGVARDIIVTAGIPEGIHIPAQLNNAFITINGSTELFKPFNPFNTRLRNYYSISGRKITFVLKNRNLPGTRTQKDIRKRTGTIRFTLKTNETGNIGPCLYSTASITFVNLDGSRNRAINAHDLVRTNCANTDPCPLAEKEGGPDNR